MKKKNAKFFIYEIMTSLIWVCMPIYTFLSVLRQSVCLTVCSLAVCISEPIMQISFHRLPRSPEVRTWCRIYWLKIDVTLVSITTVSYPLLYSVQYSTLIFLSIPNSLQVLIVLPGYLSIDFTEVLFFASPINNFAVCKISSVISHFSRALFKHPFLWGLCLAAAVPSMGLGDRVFQNAARVPKALSPDYLKLKLNI